MSDGHAQLHPNQQDLWTPRTYSSAAPTPVITPTTRRRSPMQILSGLLRLLVVISGVVVFFGFIGMSLIWGAPEWDHKADRSSAMLTPIYFGFCIYLAIYASVCWLLRKRSSR